MIIVSVAWGTTANKPNQNTRQMMWGRNDPLITLFSYTLFSWFLCELKFQNRDEMPVWSGYVAKTKYDDIETIVPTAALHPISLRKNQIKKYHLMTLNYVSNNSPHRNLFSIWSPANVKMEKIMLWTRESNDVKIRLLPNDHNIWLPH
jgi:hypothetical protein